MISGIAITFCIGLIVVVSCGAAFTRLYDLSIHDRRGLVSDFYFILSLMFAGLTGSGVIAVCASVIISLVAIGVKINGIL